MLAGDQLSLIGQLAAFAGGLIAGCCLKHRATIMATSLTAGVLVMMAHILYDGQGAFILLLCGPLIYFLSVAGRYLD